MESWFSWTLGATIGLWSFWWILGTMGVTISVWGIGLRLFRWILGSTPECSNTTLPAFLNDIEKLSNAVYLLYEPKEAPEIEIVFIHGLQLSGFKEAFWKTWTTTDEKGEEVCWPQTWLKEEFPRARILSISYDSSAICTDDTGRLDPYAAGESLAGEMVRLGGIGQRCPVVFVCHSLGGIIIKEIVIRTFDKHRNDENFKKFLENIRGFHFYATPHDGSKLADLAACVPIPFVEKGPMVKRLKVINDDLGRLNGNFERIETEEFPNKWKFSVVAEANATRMGDFYAQVVPEASARHGYKAFLKISADHFQVCKPTSKHDSAFKMLAKFIVEDVMSKKVTTGEQSRRELQLML